MSLNIISLPGFLPERCDGAGWIAAGPAATVHLSWAGRRSIDEIQLTVAMGNAVDNDRFRFYPLVHALACYPHAARAEWTEITEGRGVDGWDE